MDHRPEFPQHDFKTRADFDALCDALRPDLHRFCARMLGDACEGEDVLQDALVLAFHRFVELKEVHSLRAWLFQVAHNKCIDHLRTRRRFEPISDAMSDAAPGPDDELAKRQRALLAFSSLITDLPAKERASLLLKDVFDCSLEEVAEITESSVGAVKAALHRGRTKLDALGERSKARRRRIPESERELISRYLSAFNERDWAGVRALVSDDARLEVVNHFEGPLGESGYFSNYERLGSAWKLELASVDGCERIVQFRRAPKGWRPHAIVLLRIEGDRISSIRDYLHVDYLLSYSVVD